jgi:hypothetical protein
MNKKIFISVALMLILCACAVSNKLFENNITRIKVTTKIAGRIVEGHGENIIVEFYISYYKQYAIFELPYHVISEIDNVLIYDSTKYDYFVCSLNNKTGYLLKTPADSFGKKIKGDSILKDRAYGGGGTDSFRLEGLTIKSVKKLNNDSSIVYRYLYNDNSFYDSAYLHLDKNLKEISFSFDKSLDSINDSKLSKIQLFLKHDDSQGNPNLKDFYINSFEIAKTPVENNIKTLFERFIQDEKKPLLK